jgi:hypothetical protein
VQVYRHGWWNIHQRTVKFSAGLALAIGRAGTAAHVERIVQGWRRVDRRAEARLAERRHHSRSLTITHDDDGMVVVRGWLEPEVGALLLRALDAARETRYQKARAAPTCPGNPALLQDPAGDPPTTGQRQADALALIAEAALRHELAPCAGRPRRPWAVRARRGRARFIGNVPPAGL